MADPEGQEKEKYRRDDLHTLELRHFFLDIKAEFKSMAKKYGQNEYKTIHHNYSIKIKEYLLRLKDNDFRIFKIIYCDG